MTTFNTTRNETKNYKEIILPPYLKPSQLWIAAPRLEYCDRNDNYSSTRQEKQFAGSPIFVSTFQGGLPGTDQVSPAAPPLEQQPCLTPHFHRIPQHLPCHRDTQAVPQPPVSDSVCDPCSPAPWPARPVLSYRPHFPQGFPQAKEQDAVNTGTAKQQALSTFRSTHVPQTLPQMWYFHPLLNQHYICSSPLQWTHFQRDWNPTRSGQKNWNPFLPLFWSAAHCLSN